MAGRLVWLAVLCVTLLADNKVIGAAKNHECVNSLEEREYIRSLALQGIDEAFKDHVAHLYQIWIRDPADAMTRATAGMKSGLSAYYRARDSTISWNPPICDEKDKK